MLWLHLPSGLDHAAEDFLKEGGNPLPSTSSVPSPALLFPHCHRPGESLEMLLFAPSGLQEDWAHLEQSQWQQLPMPALGGEGQCCGTHPVPLAAAALPH